MDTESLRAAFLDWWQDSYATPPGVHAIMTHTGFAEHILHLMEYTLDSDEYDDTAK